MYLEEQLKDIQQAIQKALHTLESNSKQSITITKDERVEKLLHKLIAIDEGVYKPFCESFDDEVEGETYKHGISLEFYMEASDWHDVSVLLREIKEYYAEYS